jgi:hypothetical protein
MNLKLECLKLAVQSNYYGCYKDNTIIEVANIYVEFCKDDKSILDSEMVKQKIEDEINIAKVKLMCSGEWDKHLDK